MLDERKVRLMTSLAMYDENEGKEDFKISEYYRKDYAGLHIIFTIFWVTIGYIAVGALAVSAGLDNLLESMSVPLMVTLAMAVIVGYIVVLTFYIIVTSHTYNKRHRDARTRVKKYNLTLNRLLKIYEKENR